MAASEDLPNMPPSTAGDGFPNKVEAVVVAVWGWKFEEAEAGAAADWPNREEPPVVVAGVDCPNSNGALVAGVDLKTEEVDAGAVEDCPNRLEVPVVTG